MFTGKLDKVGVIGMGIVGSRAAENLRKAGKHVYVWSRTPKPEPNFMGSAKEVAEQADAIQIFVNNGENLLEVLENMSDALGKRHVVLNHSTIDLESTLKADQLVRETGATFVDAPFTGSKVAAENGELVYYVGADQEVVDKLRPFLDHTSRQVMWAGKVGDATVLKVATNMITATTVQVLGEALAVTQAHGVGGERLMDAINLNACGSGVAKMKLPSMMAGDFDPHFSLRNMFKDSQLALALANAHDIEIPALSTTASIMFRAIQEGHGEEDFSVIWKNYQEQSRQSEDLA